MIKGNMSNLVLEEMQKNNFKPKQLEIPEEVKIQPLPSLIEAPLKIDIDFKKQMYKFLKENNKYSVWTAVTPELLYLLKTDVQVIVEVLKGGNKNILTGIGKIKSIDLSTPVSVKSKNENIKPLSLTNKSKYQKINLDLEPLEVKCSSKIPFTVLCDPNLPIFENYKCKKISLKVIAEQKVEQLGISFLKFQIIDCSKNIDKESQAIIYINIDPSNNDFVNRQIMSLQK